MSIARATPSSYTFSTCVFLRALAVVHGVALFSFWSQWRGLVGPQGLLPAGRFFSAVKGQLGTSAYFQLPSLCWVFGAESALPVMCGIGLGLAGALFAGVAPAWCLIGLWTIYLSLVSAGQAFFNFQWDALLLEATLLAIPVASWSFLPWWRLSEPPRIARLLVWWLLARLMFLSGIVKLTSGDPTWRNLTALTFHFETQPLPTPLAWFVHQLPAPVLQLLCAGMFLIELIAPFFLFGPRRWRHRAALWLIALQIVIALTGNYAFFNALTIILCLICFDDHAWQSLRRRALPAATPTRTLPTSLLYIFATTVLAVTLTGALGAIGFSVPRPLYTLVEAAAPFESLNNYGFFAMMTHPRPEIIFEGSNDGHTWRAYEFPHKPGDLSHRPAFVAPLQPRLDWQLWFAALEPPGTDDWITQLGGQLLQGTPDILKLLKTNPFPEAAPKYIHAVRYIYRFTSGAERARTGQWWQRSDPEIFLPDFSLP